MIRVDVNEIAAAAMDFKQLRLLNCVVTFCTALSLSATAAE
jgi:hypothetical protein